MKSCFLASSKPIAIDLKLKDELGFNITTIYHQFYLIISLILFAIVGPFLMTTAQHCYADLYMFNGEMNNGA